MKKLLIVPALVLAMSSPAYAMGSFFSSGPSLEKVVTFIEGVQKAAIKACGFLPYATSVAVVYVSNPVVPIVLDFAAKICEQAQSPALKAMKPGLQMNLTVDGAKIEGQYVGAPEEPKENK